MRTEDEYNQPTPGNRKDNGSTEPSASLKFEHSFRKPRFERCYYDDDTSDFFEKSSVVSGRDAAGQQKVNTNDVSTVGRCQESNEKNQRGLFQNTAKIFEEGLFPPNDDNFDLGLEATHDILTAVGIAALIVTGGIAAVAMAEAAPLVFSVATRILAIETPVQLLIKGQIETNRQSRQLPRCDLPPIKFPTVKKKPTDDVKN